MIPARRGCLWGQMPHAPGPTAGAGAATRGRGSMSAIDVRVVGAGITGATCAYHLARRGTRVRVVERAPLPATGSTGRSAAGLRHQYSHPENVRMSLHSAAAVSALAGVALPVTPSRRNVYLTAPLDGLPHPTPLIVDVASGVYPRSDGRRVLFGLSNPDETPGERLDVDWSWLDTVLGRALPRFPFLEHAALDRRACWAGLYAMTPDHVPGMEHNVV